MSNAIDFRDALMRLCREHDDWETRSKAHEKVYQVTCMHDEVAQRAAQARKATKPRRKGASRVES